MASYRVKEGTIRTLASMLPFGSFTKAPPSLLRTAADFKDQYSEGTFRVFWISQQIPGLLFVQEGGEEFFLGAWDENGKEFHIDPSALTSLTTSFLIRDLKFQTGIVIAMVSLLTFPLIRLLLGPGFSHLVMFVIAALAF